MSATAEARLRVLCVDDEPSVVAGLGLHLRRRYDVEAAHSGADGLAVLERVPAIAVVISDMRMPNMNGADFLQRVRERFPDAVRMLLTGHSEIDAAIAAINEGQIFRFLTKPCAPPTLMAAVDAAAVQHRLLASERELLEQTLHGSIKALCDVLALTSPIAFGRANRIKHHVTALADQLQLRERWQLEVAAMVCQLGCIALPEDTVAKLHYGHDLGADEAQMVARIPTVNEQLLANIPRLEVVRRILVTCARPYRAPHAADDATTKLVTSAASVLKAAIDFEALVATGRAPSLAVDAMRGRQGCYDPAVVAVLGAFAGAGDDRAEVRELTAAALRVGMVLAEDAKLANGTLLVTRGFEVTAGFVERVRNFKPGAIREPLRVVTGGGAKRVPSAG